MVLRSSGLIPQSQGHLMAEPSPSGSVAQRQVAQKTVALKQSPVQLVGSADRHTSRAADRSMMACERAYAAWNRTGLTAPTLGIGAHEPNVRALLRPHLFATDGVPRLVSITVLVVAWSGSQSDRASGRPRSEQAKVCTIP